MEEKDKYGKELDLAVRIVHMACSLCQKVQRRLLSTASDQVLAKDDDSPVTIADWSVQATVSWLLSEFLEGQNVSIVAEEDAQTLSKSDAANLLAAVVDTVNECLADAPRYGLWSPKKALGTSEILEAIRRCNSTGGAKGRHWVLDPVDGTLGFVRGDQYAVALALIEDGKLVLGVLGCPNYPMKKELLNYNHQRHQTLPGSPTPSNIWEKGCVMYARRGTGQAWMQPLIHGDTKFEWPNSARLVQVSPVVDPSLATFCEPVEKANSNHSFTAGLAISMGLWTMYGLRMMIKKMLSALGFDAVTKLRGLNNLPHLHERIKLECWKKPMRVHSMVKYAAIARGDAEIFIKFARSGYKEKIWDHAAGVVIIEEAGGVVTDAGGRSLDFSRGVYLEGLDRGIIACSGLALHEKIIGAVYASWDSSNL
ncbi:Inositol monophosphatase [Corchorus capsularis]|uniref:3'(2'),5'-bisphosphate nucleotidase n=1 Tax=Corchorus capsularis TaxID=210143 RepID=A0A1R3ICV1_COCAP|nr:Inositol monophosphatase [Corchorus capsularis]